MDLKAWRKSQGLTQAQAGALIGVHGTTWGRIERGKETRLKHLRDAQALVSGADQPVVIPVALEPADPVYVKLDEWLKAPIPNTPASGESVKADSLPIAQTTEYLTLRSHEGRKVMTFADIAAAYDVAESTVRRAFSDNRQRWERSCSESEQEAALVSIQTPAGTRPMMLFTLKGASRFAFHLRSGRAEQVQDHCLELLMAEAQGQAVAPVPITGDIPTWAAALMQQMGNGVIEVRQQMAATRERVEQIEAAVANVDQQIADRFAAAELERRLVADGRAWIKRAVNQIAKRTEQRHSAVYAALFFALRVAKLDDVQARDQVERAVGWLRATAADCDLILPAYQPTLPGVAV